MAEQGCIDEFERELIDTFGHNQNSEGQIASQILFQKFLEKCLMDILEGIEFVRLLGLTDKNISVTFENENDGYRSLKFDVL